MEWPKEAQPTKKGITKTVERRMNERENCGVLKYLAIHVKGESRKKKKKKEKKQNKGADGKNQGGGRLRP